MFKSFAGARLGIFLFLGTILMVSLLFIIGNKESLFTQTIQVNTYFNDVNTLKSGAPVLISGYQIGSVKSISLIPDSVGLVHVKMSINYDAVNFIRLDSKASIETKGFIGQKYISISPGSKEVEIIKDGGVISSEESFNVQEIITQTTEIMSYTKDITKEFSEIVAKINRGDGTIGKLINNDELYQATVNIIESGDTSLLAITDNLNSIARLVTNLGENLNGIFSSVDTTSENINRLIANIQNGKGAVGKLLSDKAVEDSIISVVDNFSSTVSQLELTSTRFAENMEALKHNWLFKDYFEERGYWDYDTYTKEIEKKIKELNDKIAELKALEEKQNK